MDAVIERSKQIISSHYRISIEERLEKAKSLLREFETLPETEQSDRQRRELKEWYEKSQAAFRRKELLAGSMENKTTGSSGEGIKATLNSEINSRLHAIAEQVEREIGRADASISLLGESTHKLKHTNERFTDLNTITDRTSALVNMLWRQASLADALILLTFGLFCMIALYILASRLRIIKISKGIIILSRYFRKVGASKSTTTLNQSGPIKGTSTIRHIDQIGVTIAAPVDTEAAAAVDL